MIEAALGFFVGNEHEGVSNHSTSCTCGKPSPYAHKTLAFEDIKAAIDETSVWYDLEKLIIGRCSRDLKFGLYDVLRVCSCPA